ncbi:uncharacterized protein LOC130993662 isoform X2 [Salvia miltiorrhiza]|uniref:uncharacterized protein LOC130993662 isoform X2 n=1 Tax=Salvia miltiorrhiza TaxID=226208 RepID=UPI0025AC1278|nr:uncharacterized protein LOC130993662 isoform X2 [Salvia miltiorrhiza]
MASSIFSVFFVIIFLQFCLILTQVAGRSSGELIYEDGYTVTTIIDGDKSNVKVNPQSIIHQSPPSDLFIILDSVDSTFYTALLPTTSNGVTTIAGGYSQKAGRADGPARDALFSDDFELIFSSEICALLISDHGNRLVRQISLKAEDCSRQSGSVLGTTSAWLLGLGLCSLISLAVGLVIRPYVIPYEGVRPHQPPWTWTHCRMSLERQVVMLCSDLRSAVVKSTVYLRSHQIILLVLSHLSLMFRRTPLESRASCRKIVSLLDMDEVCNTSSSNGSSSSSRVISQRVADQLKDLLTFDEGLLMAPVNADEMVVREEGRESTYEHKTIDGMIKANLANFEGEALRVDSFASPDCRLGVVRQR